MGRDDIIIVDSLGSSDKWKNLLGKKYKSYFDKKDFLAMLEAGELHKSIEAIVHLGACTDTTERDMEYLMQNNFEYTKILAMLCVGYNIRMIYASSAATYGLGENGYSDKIFAPLRPLNAYGFSKQLFDLWMLENGLDTKLTGFKFFNVFGPNEYHKDNMASMIFKAYNQIKDTGSVRLFKSHVPEYTDGAQLRDFVYVKDVVDVLYFALNSPSMTGIYNLGTGKARSWNDLMSSVFSALGKPTNIEYINMPDNLKNQYQNFTEADMTKFKITNCPVEFSSLEDSVSDYVKNYLEKQIPYL
jgi:ADP-L-glycero-D-manno-heptose 6-epimerase